MGQFKTYIGALFLLISLTSKATTPVDSIFDVNVKTVQLYAGNLALTTPVAYLNTSTSLTLSFDYLGDDIPDLSYTVVHCDQDWSPSELTPFEYLEGFEEDYLSNYELSFNSLQPYIHFSNRLPNETIQFKVSGNYKVIVYQDGDSANVVFTKGFYVVDPKFSIEPKFVRPADVKKFTTHQEIDFRLLHNGLNLQNPQQEVSVNILQNNRFDNAITNIKPLFVRNEALDFDYRDVITFASGKEFRIADLRTVRFQSEHVQALKETDEGYEAFLFVDPERGHLPYLYKSDVNGHYVITNLDRLVESTESEYLKTYFFYKPVSTLPQDIYLVGGFNNWSIDDSSKLTYLPQEQMYYTDVLLKQGFYNYQYVTKDKDGTISHVETEGNSYEAENDYQILVYFRGFGDRYDQLLGFRQFNNLK